MKPTLVNNNHASIDRRKGEKPIPDNLEDYLSEMQLLAIRRLQNFGWDLKFVRRPLFQQSIAVISNSQQDRYGLLEEDGTVDYSSEIQVRNDKFISELQVNT